MKDACYAKKARRFVRPKFACLIFCLVFFICATFRRFEKPKTLRTYTAIAAPTSIRTSTTPSTTLPVLRIDAVLAVRIYRHDKAKWTTFELDQWVKYMIYAGVQTIYLYDCHMTDDEALKKWAASRSNILYIDWGKYNHPHTLGGTQIRAYQHAIDSYGHLSDWQIAFDMDEYPFSLIDFDAGWLPRRINALSRPEISELSIKNFLFLGNDTSRPSEWVAERIVRRTPFPANTLDKPIYRPKNVRAQMHHNILQSGSSVDVPASELRMNHYWGMRLQNWGLPCETNECMSKTEMIKKTVFDNSSFSLISRVQKVYK